MSTVMRHTPCSTSRRAEAVTVVGSTTSRPCRRRMRDISSHAMGFGIFFFQPAAFVGDDRRWHENYEQVGMEEV
jgi:hypothetical protein